LIALSSEFWLLEENKSQNPEEEKRIRNDVENEQKHIFADHGIITAHEWITD